MSLTTLAVAASLTAASPCHWNKPGATPYRGPVMQSVSQALARYTDIPADAAAQITSKARLLQPDTLVTITRDGVESPDGTATNLRDMHYGKDRLCAGPVERSAWKDTHAEPAFVYCSGEHCIAVPIVCGNVSRIDYKPMISERAEPLLRPGFEPEGGYLERPIPQPIPRLGFEPDQRGFTPSPMPRPINPPYSVPEPSSMALLLAALASMVISTARRT